MQSNFIRFLSIFVMSGRLLVRVPSAVSFLLQRRQHRICFSDRTAISAQKLDATNRKNPNLFRQRSSSTSTKLEIATSDTSSTATIGGNDDSTSKKKKKISAKEKRQKLIGLARAVQ
jgi:hypothetical protein